MGVGMVTSYQFAEMCPAELEGVEGGLTAAQKTCLLAALLYGAVGAVIGGVAGAVGLGIAGCLESVYELHGGF